MVFSHDGLRDSLTILNESRKPSCDLLVLFQEENSLKGVIPQSGYDLKVQKRLLTFGSKISSRFP